MPAVFMRPRLLMLAIASSTLALVACSSPAEPDSQPGSAGASVQIEDNHGTQTVATPPKSPVATDNTVLETLGSWNVKLVAAPVDLLPPTSPYAKDSSVVNLGNHSEPNLEALVAAQPDLVVNGYRFASKYEEIKKLVPEASVVELDGREGQPLDAELKRQTTELGKIFGHEDDAAKLVQDFDASVARVKAAYDPKDKVMAVITSGGEINYAAPSSGRTLGPVFDILGLTPALKAEGSSDHQGDDISVESIAKSNPDWILVMDRDAAVGAESGEKYTPANELLAKSPALKNVKAVTGQRIVYMPQYTYLTEGIQTYTEFFNSIADQLEKS